MKDGDVVVEKRERDVLLIAWIRVWDSFALKKHAHPEGFNEFFFRERESNKSLLEHLDVEF